MAAAGLLAWRSPALPFALWGAPAVLFGLLGRDPLASGAVEVGLVCFALLAIALAVVRDPSAPRLLGAPPVLLAVLLAILIGVRLSSSDASRFELRRFLAEGLLFLAGGVVIGRRRRDLDLWALALAATATASALLVTVGLAFDHDRWADANPFALYADATPRALARDTAAALVAAGYVALSNRDERVRLAALTAVPVLLIGYSASGDRGPLLGLVAGLVVLLALTLRRSARDALLLGVVPVLAAAVLVGRLVSEDGASRLLGILVGTAGSAHVRVDEWSGAWHAFASHRLGGTGVAMSGGDVFLEAAAQLGIGGLLAVAVLVVWLAVALVWIEHERRALVAALTVAAVVDAAVAGGLATTPYLWFAAGLAAATVPARSGLIRRTRGEMLAPVPPEESALAPPPPRAAPLDLGLALDEVEPVVGGTITLRARADDDDALRWVEFQVSPAGRHEWETLARVDRPPFALELDTARLADGLYDFRALGADRGGRVELSRPARAREVANVGREVAILEPPAGSWVRGVVALVATAPAEFELSRDGGAWQPLEGDAWDTAKVPDGEYLLRARAADRAATSDAIAVAVDNTPPEVRVVETLELPGPPAAVRIAADAADAGSGVLAVRFQGSYDGSLWDELASIAGPPFEIDLETEALAAPYYVRCVASDGAGNEAASSPLRVFAPPPPAPELSIERATLWDLERLVAANPADPAREEREALLYSLRPYASVDGTIPAELWDLVRSTFGDLVA